jgi:hypothetical protein
MRIRIDLNEEISTEMEITVEEMKENWAELKELLTELKKPENRVHVEAWIDLAIKKYGEATNMVPLTKLDGLEETMERILAQVKASTN